MPQIEQIAPIVTRRLRQRVLYPNQPIASVILDEDNDGIHFGLYDHNTLIAVVSLFFSGQEAQFRKFAIDETYQRQGYGSKLLQYITDYAFHEGAHILWCNARITAVSFYQKNDYIKVGSPFVKGSINYVRMEKILRREKSLNKN